MSKTEDRVLKALRLQAWQRAKGELMAVLESYNSESTTDEHKQAKCDLHHMEKACNDFISHVEGKGLAK